MNKCKGRQEEETMGRVYYEVRCIPTNEEADFDVREDAIAWAKKCAQTLQTPLEFMLTKVQRTTHGVTGDYSTLEVTPDRDTRTPGRRKKT